ncbi:MULTISPECIES: alpha/beta fold hydrolase [unclassified Streptomyces]|uniref:alpha/beta fold hydrolase n=1 Tax=unclassified Streptomyces TaxID=2593676 RepID=UPI00225AC25C|nr:MULTISPECIES: alpha/beta fold hydrolase [unclassified Streptomyces]WSP53048.1 alpha/beta fold hydrolase [Streptomyces sp. NBC_01241]WSU19645.1 alpha/beta fold hydrolase [Streptomyces sp. NBC_01108]MCX4800058.1 alpha/beta fold hydrolase [Streptomyces sp. NBC_01242]WSJ40754.1 alpha/beta fold hydrolase [Streptomyces sp. NBC_01321]WSP59803.1 alpha/beta fold hydrolase [Streptomyces sp. NBC_01241]
MVNGELADSAAASRVTPGPDVLVWLVHVDDEAAARRALSVLPAAEQDRLDRMLEPHRRRGICAQAALRILVAAATSAALPLPELVRGQNGKPVLQAWGSTGEESPETGLRAHTSPAGKVPALRVNLTHSGTLAAVALTTAGEVGVDVERERPLAELDGMARIALSPSEYREWHRSDESARQGLLFQSWTRKEAVLKALGTGLAGDLRSVATRLPRRAGAAVRVEGLPKEAGAIPCWTVRDLEVAAGYSGSVAVHAPRARVRQRQVSIGALLSTVGPPPAADRPAGEGGGSRLKLFCLPPAGSNAESYRLWHPRLPRGVDVVPIDLPGHGTRLREPLIDEWDALVRDLSERLVRQIDGPYAVLGHGLGALLAFEVLRALAGRAAPPELLVVVGRNGPSAPLSCTAVHEPASTCLPGLPRLGDLPHATDVARMFRPELRADLRLAERYVRRFGPRLSCPVLAVAGRQDRAADGVGMEVWRQETAGGCEAVWVDGGCSLLEGGEFMSVLNARLARLKGLIPAPSGYVRGDQ